MSEQIGSNGNELTITIPSSGERDWAVSIRDNCFNQISSHTHQGSGAGAKLKGYLALDLTEAILTNNTNLLSVDQVGTGTVSLIKADANDELVLSTTVASASFQDDGLTILDNADNTKILDFQASAITTGNTRTLTMADEDVDLAGLKNSNVSASAAIALTKLAALTASEMVISDGSGFIVSAPVATYPSLTELTYLKGVTSAIQTQIDAKISAVTGTTNEITITSSTQVGLSDDPVIPGTDAMVVPSGTTAQRSSTTDGAFRFNSDLNTFEGYKNSAWGSIGGGSGGLDVINTQDFELDVASSATTGLNATFGTAGTFDGALANDTSTEIAGDQSLKYTAGSASTNDWFEVETITLETKAKGEWVGITLYADMSNFAKDVDFVVLTDEGDVLTTSGTDILTASASKARYSFSVFMPSTATSFTYGCHMVNAPVNTENFIIDECEITLNPFVYKNMVDVVEIQAYQSGNMSVTSTITAFSVDTIDADGDGSISSGAVLVPKAGRYRLKIGAQYFGNNETMVYGYDLNGSITSGVTKNNASNVTAGYGHTEEEFIVDLVAGDLIKPAFSNSVSRTFKYGSVSLTAMIDSEHVITPAKSNMTDPVSYSPTITGFGTTSGEEFAWSQEGKFIVIQGRFISGTATAVEAQITLPNSYTLDFLDTTTIKAVGTYARGGATRTSNGGVVLGTDGDAFLNFSAATVWDTTSVDPLGAANGSAPVAASGDIINFIVRVPVAELTSDAVFLAAVPTQLTGYIDTGATYHNNAVAATTSYKTVTLQSIASESDSFFSISSNILSLSKGKYDLNIPIGGNGGCNGVHLGVYNSTDSVYFHEFSRVAYADTDRRLLSNVKVTLTLTKSTDIEFRTKSDAAVGEELASRITVTKIK